MNAKILQDFFEDQDFTIHPFEQDGMQCAEVETWTNGGVNMIFTLMPFLFEKFIERVESFDVDEEIDLHRQDQKYKDNFTIREALEDFTDFHIRLTDVIEKYKLKYPDNEDA